MLIEKQIENDQIIGIILTDDRYNSMFIPRNICISLIEMLQRFDPDCIGMCDYVGHIEIYYGYDYVIFDDAFVKVKVEREFLPDFIKDVITEVL